MSQHAHALSPGDLLAAAAALAAADLDRFVTDLLALRAERRAPRLSPAEAQLLLRIHRALPAELRSRHDALRARLAAQTLSGAEHDELLRLTDQIELLQAERVEALSELARLRGKKLGALMDELGIEGPGDGGAHR